MSSALLDQLLEEQRCQTPVSRFAREHERGLLPERGAYRELIPLSKPGPGEQYAFAVDLDRCTGCKACVAACHSLNGLDDEETWREVGHLVVGDATHHRIQTITSACHHCIKPGCLEGCPVLAYEKDPVTGIVRHLDDQCIGCSYCILKCPYEVPKYSKKLGIVRKCDMCHSRLAVGEAPACVQACPTSAITIRTISVADAIGRARFGEFLPDSPDPAITLPTTTYTSGKPISVESLAADHHHPRVQHAHWPLVLMLVLTQAGAGAAVAALLAGAYPWALLLGAGCFFAGLFCSVAHLGQPLKAWRAFLGWRTSWLSREIMVFGIAAPLLAGAAAWPFIASRLPQPAELQTALTIAAAVAALLGVLCSAFVYHDTRRQVWRGPLTFLRFFWTTAIFAAAFSPWPTATAGMLIIKLALEIALASRGGRRTRSPLDDLDRSAQLLRGELRPWFAARLVTGILAIGAVLLSIPPIFTLPLLLLGEILERALFFKAGVSTRMPGL